MSGTFIDTFSKADRNISIAKSTTDVLIQAHNEEYGYDSGDTVYVLMGILENLNIVKNCLDQMFDDIKERREMDSGTNESEREYYKSLIIETIDQIENRETMAKIYTFAKTHLKMPEDKYAETHN